LPISVQKNLALPHDGWVLPLAFALLTEGLPHAVVLDASSTQSIPARACRSPTDLGKQTLRGITMMKTILSALIALSALTAVAASANAFDAKSFYEELDRCRT
jgi:hypothetical protein